ncbi:hypothetical protein JZ751_018274 [Albula glossodonta]|uniref:Uncharacterized protein n=1 Tax=Albula glossodonta TaxID=121402 RepID=A0A8T2P010_9TELE|nr:hypothetical protein JZ751_018274 [Albula glossodonta]
MLELSCTFNIFGVEKNIFINILILFSAVPIEQSALATILPTCPLLFSSSIPGNKVGHEAGVSSLCGQSPSMNTLKAVLSILIMSLNVLVCVFMSEPLPPSVSVSFRELL